MMDETLVNVLRMRNLPDVQRMLAPKWQRAVAIVDWLTTQIPQRGISRFMRSTPSPTPIMGAPPAMAGRGDEKALIPR